MGPGKRFDVVGLGLNSVDLLCRVDRYPSLNTKTTMRAFSRQGGGQTATALVALSRLGLRVAYVGAVGDDGEGRFSVRSLEAEGVNVEGVVVQPGRASQLAVILVPPEGERTILWRREVRVEPADLRRELITAGRLLHLDGHALEAERMAAQWAREAGMAVSFDAERVGPGTEELVALSDYCIGAEDFPTKFAGTGDREAALRALRALGPKVVGVTLGAEGALAYDGERFVHSPAFPAEVVDTTGAGDAFHAGFIYGMLTGLGLRESLRCANALGALCCTRLGGRAGLPTLGGLQRFLEEHPAEAS